MVDYTDLLDWSKARGIFQKRIQSWDTTEKVATERRRSLRKIDVDVQALRDSGQILKDETFIPVRVADGNIRQAHAQYMNYLRGSRKLVLFTPEVSTTKLNVDLLENNFSNGMKYLKWDITYERS